MSDADMKDIVREKYSKIALKEKGCCCGGKDDYSFVGESYVQIDGHVASADLGLGCGIPTEFARIKPGDHVVDLGSGAGNDVFVARRIVGETGHVTGIDFTEAMFQKAEANRLKLNISNVEFKLGDIEHLPLINDSADVIISNCVLNLVPDKAKAFAEIYRTLKPGGHFCVSDIVLTGELPAALKTEAELYAGCISGALSQENYLEIVKNTGFKNIEIKKIREIEIPESMIESTLSRDKAAMFKNSGAGVFSLTVTGYKQDIE